MKTKKRTYLQKFLKQNANVNLASLSPKNNEQMSSLNWKRMLNQKQETLLQLKTYQRLLKLLPNSLTEEQQKELIFQLIDGGLHSALQIGAIPRQKFITTYSHLFNNDRSLIAFFFNKAQMVRRHVLLQYMNIRQSK